MKRELHIKGHGLEDMGKRDRYVGNSPVENHPQSRIKWDDTDTTKKNRKMKSSEWRPFKMIDSKDILSEESRLEKERRERRTSLWELKNDQSIEITGEPIVNYFNGKTSRKVEDVPIGKQKERILFLISFSLQKKLKITNKFFVVVAQFAENIRRSGQKKTGLFGWSCTS